MTVNLILKRNEWDDPDPRKPREDFSVYFEDKVIGRIYNRAGVRQDKWRYAVNDWGSALADSREEAMAALKEKFEQRLLAGLIHIAKGIGNITE